jgi:FAD/FMN-containing dehydrogenase
VTSELTTQKFEDFPTVFKGPTLRPGDAGFSESRLLWNMRRGDEIPALIVRPLDPEDVVVAVDYARRHGAAIAVRSGGHGVDGHAMPHDALVIDTSKMKRISVDAATGRATLEAGVLLGEMDAATQEHGYAVPAGVVSNTGVAGLTLGGGVGHLSRTFGATVDNLLSIDVVTMDGRVITASAESNPDLFWGMRGAGHNLAIATSFTFQGQKVGPQVVSGVLVYSPQEALSFCAGIDEAMSRSPRELSIPMIFTPAPPLPGLPEELVGTPLLLAVVIYVGPVGGYDAAMSEVNALATPLANMVGPTSWCATNSLVDAFQPIGGRYHSGGGYLSAMRAEIAALALDRVAAAPVPTGPATGCLISFPMLGGALRDGDEDACAFSRTGAGWVSEVVAMWDTEPADDEYMGWVAEGVEALAPYSTGTGYINLTADRGPEWLRNVYGSAEKWERIVELKRKWDPDNRLAHNKNVLRAADAKPVD